MITKCPVCGDGLIRKKYISKKDGTEQEFLSHETWVKDAPQCAYKTPFLNFLGQPLSDDQVKELIEDGKTKKLVTIKVPLKLEDGKVSIDYAALKK